MPIKLLIIRRFLVLCLLSTTIGCSVVAPRFQPDMNTVNDIKDTNLKSMRTGTFSTANTSVNEITLRGNKLVSPYNNSYVKYLEKALIEQLRQAYLWDNNSTIVVSGELLQNEVDPSMSSGQSDISARFVVHEEDKEIYNKIHTIRHTWPSSFFGPIAIPNAINNYSTSVNKLLSKFLLDKDLSNIVKK